MDPGTGTVVWMYLFCVRSCSPCPLPSPRQASVCERERIERGIKAAGFPPPSSPLCFFFRFRPFDLLPSHPAFFRGRGLSCLALRRAVFFSLSLSSAPPSHPTPAASSGPLAGLLASHHSLPRIACVHPSILIDPSPTFGCPPPPARDKPRYTLAAPSNPPNPHSPQPHCTHTMFATPPSPSPSVSPSSTLPPQLPHIPPFTSSDTFRDMSLEHHLLSLTLGDVPPPTMSYPSQPIHPFDHPDALQNRCKSNGKDTPTTPHNNSVYPCHPVHAKTIKKSKNGALSALSRRFAPGLPSRSLSSPATATLASLAAAGSDPKSGSGSSSGASSSSAFGAHRSADELSCPPSRPLTGCSQERGRHHSISGAPSQDSRRPRSACASSCSSSSTSSASTTSTSSTPSSSSSSSPPCPATSSSPPPPPPPFFSSSTLYTLFGSSASTPSYLHTPTDPSIATTSLPATPSPLGPPSGTTIHKMTTTRQTRSASCTSFSLPSLFIPKDTPNARANHHSSNPLSPTVRSSDTRPPLSLGSLARLNAQQQEIQPVHPQPLQPIFHRSNPVSPSAAYQQTKFPITSPTTSPTSLPPLPVFHSLSSLTFSASDLGSPDTLSPVSAHAKDQCHSSIMMGTTPLSSTESLCEIGGMAAVAGSPVDVSCSVRSQVYAQHHPYARAHSHPQVHLYGQIPIHAHHATHAAASQASFEAGSTRLEWSLSGRSSSSTSVNSIGRSSLMPPASPESSTFSSDSNCLGGSRRSSKDSSLDSAPGVTLNDLVDQLTIPDYVNTVEQITKTKVFLMIYRKFLRPRELLEMFIDRFEDVGKTTDDDDEEARNTRLRICACLHYWFRHHPNDLIHWQTRQRVVTFLKERVAAFPSLSEIYMKLLPLSSVRYFNSWRWPQQYQHGPESDGSLPAGSAMEDFESGIYNVSGAPSEHMDEDRDWGLYDEDEVLSESKKSMSMENLSPFRPVINAPGLRVNTGKSVSGMCRQGRTTPRAIPAQMSRDRRSSTGSLAHSSACAMEAVVAGRRGSASSVTSGTTHSSPLNPSYVPPSNHSEGDLTPQQQQPQSAISIPFMAKRNGIRHRGASPGGPLHPLHPLHPGGGNATIMSKETSEETTMHPLLGGRVNSLPPSVDYLSMNTPFIDIKDAAIAAQLTCVEFGLFKKLKPRDLLRQVWKTSRGPGSATFQACIAHFNFISSWVGTMILSPAKAKNRAKMMEKFINIAKILRDMGNFNTTMAIIGAMNTSPIHRLIQTRELLQGKEVWTTFKELEHLMSYERSFSEYRQALKAQKQPCIPYLGVHIGDLLSISEGNRDYRQDGMIHWQKFCLLTDAISTVMQFQKEPYPIQPDPFISRVITDTDVLDDEALYARSVGAEPNKLHHSRSISKFNFFWTENQRKQRDDHEVFSRS